MVTRARVITLTIFGLLLLAPTPAASLGQVHHEAKPAPIDRLSGLRRGRPHNMGPSLHLSESGEQSVTQGDYTWDTACVECPKWFTEIQGRSLQIDGNGHPHIVYGHDDLYYAWHDGSEWHREIVDEAPGRTGWYPSLALDQSGRPRVSYFECGSPWIYGRCYVGHLRYAWRDAGQWHASTVDGAFNVGLHTSLALDSSGLPRISYQACGYESGGECDESALKYAWYDHRNGRQRERARRRGWLVHLSRAGSVRPPPHQLR